MIEAFCIYGNCYESLLVIIPMCLSISKNNWVPYCTVKICSVKNYVWKFKLQPHLTRLDVFMADQLVTLSCTQWIDYIVTLLWFVVLIYWWIFFLHIFRVTSLWMWQPNDCPYISEAAVVVVSCISKRIQQWYKNRKTFCKYQYSHDIEAFCWWSSGKP